MGAAYADAVGVKAGDGAEHHAAFKCGDARCLCGHKFGVIGQYGGGVDYHLRALNILCLLVEHDGYAERAYTGKSVGFVVVGAAEQIALLVQYLGYRAHSRAADADKMYPFNAFEERINIFHRNFLSSSFSTRRAARRYYKNIILHNFEKIKRKFSLFAAFLISHADGYSR